MWLPSLLPSTQASSSSSPLRAGREASPRRPHVRARVRSAAPSAPSCETCVQNTCRGHLACAASAQHFLDKQHNSAAAQEARAVVDDAVAIRSRAARRHVAHLAVHGQREAPRSTTATGKAAAHLSVLCGTSVTNQALLCVRAGPAAPSSALSPRCAL